MILFNVHVDMLSNSISDARNSELRQQQAGDLIDDLKRANG